MNAATGSANDSSSGDEGGCLTANICCWDQVGQDEPDAVVRRLSWSEYDGVLVQSRGVEMLHGGRQDTTLNIVNEREEILNYCTSPVL